MKCSASQLLSLAAVVGSTLFLAACDKNNDPNMSSDGTVTAQDQGLAEDETAALADLTTAAAPTDVAVPNSPAVEADDLTRLAGSCLVRTYDATTRTLTLDFGATNCMGPTGVARRGKIVTVFSGPSREAGATRTITLVDYYRNDNLHAGTRVITRLDGDSWSLATQNARVVTPAGTHSWSASRIYTRTAGQGTRTFAEDEYSVTGQSDGINRKGVGYSATIGQPLIRKFQPGCARTFVAGTVDLLNDKNKQALLNYDPSGTQACDNLAALTVNGVTRTIRVGGGL